MRKVLLMAGLLVGSSTATAVQAPTGADNLFKSDTVTMERVTFHNQYHMTVVGNLFSPKGQRRGSRYFVSDLAWRPDLAAARAWDTIGTLDFPFKDPPCHHARMSLLGFS